MRMPVQVVCPRCGQGWVTDQVVEQTGDRLWVCEECDATWQLLEPVRSPGFEDLSAVLRRSGTSLGDATLRAPRPGDPDPRADVGAWFDRTFDDDPGVRLRAVGEVAPAASTTDAGARLVELLDDPEAAVAAAAAAGLARYGDDASFAAVLAAVGGADGARREQLVRAVVEVASAWFFTAHRLVGRLDAVPDAPADLASALREVVAPPA